ncbi:MAG: hypothetical protein AB7I38_18590 [Dehalococcoidia bacterium]
MAGKSTYLTDALLNHVLRNTTYTPPSTVYAGLFSAAPSDAGGGTELSGSGYARQAVTLGAPEAGTPTGRQCKNAGAVTFGPATADWSEATHFGIFDAATAGNLLYWASLASSRTVLNGDTGSFAADALIVKED